MTDKAKFLKDEYIPLLSSLNPDSERRWGKMNVQQMIEHMADSFRIANGRDEQTLMTPDEHVPRMQDFIRSEKPFKENTVNKLMNEEPVPVRHTSVQDALSELQEEIAYFFQVFDRQEGLRIMNAFFGLLDYELWVRLLYKHAWHHLRQFGQEMPAEA